MKSLVYLVVFLLSFFQFGWSTINSENFFNRVKEQNEKNYPKNINALLESTVVSFQLKNIPNDAVELGKKPELYLKFKYGYAPILVIDNVSLFYANFFAPFESIIQKSGLFLGVDNYKNYKIFSREYKFNVKLTAEGYVVKIKEREGLPGDYAEFVYKKDLMIYKAFFYEEKEKTGEIKFFYQDYENKRLPKRIIIVLLKKVSGMKEFFVDFEKYDFKNIPKKLF